MKIAFTGGGSGGHFYPSIAIAEAIGDISRKRRLLAPKLYYLGPTPFDARALFENNLIYIKISAGKVRRYSSLQNFFDLFTTLGGFFAALVTLFRIYPDVIISKGGYGSVPVVLAAAVLGIPIMVHESDAKPGRANLLAARFARRIAINFPEAAKYFPKKAQGKIARTGIPVRKELLQPDPEGAKQYLSLEPELPTLFIIGGSLGAKRINEVVVAALPDLVSFANIIHQTGTALYSETSGTAKVALDKNPNASRYHPFPYLDALSIRRAVGATTLVISRAGSGAIAEIAMWKKPSILIPIPESISHDQRTNAYSYARTGAAVVLEESNITPHLFVSEAKRIASNADLARTMGEKGATFADPDAANVLAEEALAIGLSHE